MNKSNYKVIGVMSGTSLDGLDMVYAHFSESEKGWSYEIIDAITVEHSVEILKKLPQLAFASDGEIADLDIEFGRFIGKSITESFNEVLNEVDFIASHGHTAKHSPSNGYTIQIGNAGEIFGKTGRPVINNFRAKDVAFGGQGAPLVPIGDRDLFSDYNYCVNLGGIANISLQHDNERIAFDICPFNMALNQVSEALGFPFDKGGRLAEAGEVDSGLLKQLRSISFYKESGPKSLAFEDYVKFWQPLIQDWNISNEHKLRTLVEHFANEIASVCSEGSLDEKMILTGGGTHNSFFVSVLKNKLPNIQIDIPDKLIIDFKEALIFGYLGVLKYLNRPNCLASVTGAKCDNVGGEVYGFDQ